MTTEPAEKQQTRLTVKLKSDGNQQDAVGKHFPVNPFTPNNILEEMYKWGDENLLV